jgi:hypothetical protein
MVVKENIKPLKSHFWKTNCLEFLIKDSEANPLKALYHSEMMRRIFRNQEYTVVQSWDSYWPI